ncbi:STAS domain-containing protein [Streptomyces sp. NPDC020490]|uniref:STAS domain-containing protein n=1 Tax=Streptomyces sp. NPDC020490 TaxID=3365078 RepID=UPI0037981EA6
MTFLLALCRVDDLPGCTLITLPDEIDLANGALLLDAVAAAVTSRLGRMDLLVLDLTGTGFMDSQGARLVGDVHRFLAGRVPLRVVAAPGGLPSRVLELTGIRRDVPVFGNLTEALPG